MGRPLNKKSVDLFEQTESLSARDIYERVMGALLKHLVLFILFFIVVLGAGVFIVLRLPPVYVSKANLMFGTQSGGQTMQTLSLLPGLNTVVPQDYFDSIIKSEFYKRQLVESLEAAGYSPVRAPTIEREVNRALDFSIQKNVSESIRQPPGTGIEQHHRIP